MDSQISEIPPREKRRHTDEPNDNRNRFQRDRDRILYNAAFRRLAGVTQVVAAEEGDVFHNRLTHSLKVAQFGRRLAERLNRSYPSHVIESIGGIDPDVVEAAGLAHDIGHPPFGHAAEGQLQNLTKDIGSFEGNAQSFRVVTKLAVHAAWDEQGDRPKYPGLDLTRATLNAILKYPWQRNKNGEYSARKWGAYDTEVEDLTFARELTTPGDLGKSVEATLMDWSDDVTYAVHDMEDFYRAGLIPLERLRRRRAGDPNETRRREAFFKEVFSREHGEAAAKVRDGTYLRLELEQAFEDICQFIPIEEPYAGTQEQRCSLRNMTSCLIARYIHAVDLRPGGTSQVFIDPQYRKEVIMWKELTWSFVIDNPALASQQRGQRTIISTLLDVFCTEASKRNFSVFPFSSRECFQKATTDQEITRAIVDLIGSMTEQQAVAMYQRLTGVSLGSIFQPIIR